jgi:hypothetical protein
MGLETVVTEIKPSVHVITSVIMIHFHTLSVHHS